MSVAARARVASAVAVAVLGALGVSAAPAASQDSNRGPDFGSCTVERIIDGDTFVCGGDEDGGDAWNGGERVRLILVNTPEMSDAPLGEIARRELDRLMPPGTRVELEGDVSERDRYGRILAYVHLPDGRMVNRVMVRRGYAQVMVVPPDVRHVELIAAARDSARADGAGLWDRERGFAAGPTNAPGASADRPSGCHPSYPDVCIPPPPPDLNCGDLSEGGIRVRGADPHGLDGDGDGIGCESGG